MVSKVQAEGWASFHQGAGSPLFEVLRESASLAYLEGENHDGSFRPTVYGPEGEPAFTLERVPRAALQPTQYPPRGARTGARRRVPEAADDDGNESAG